MMNKIVSLEAGEDGKLKRKDNVGDTSYNLPRFTTKDVSDIIKETTMSRAENASGLETGDRGDSMSEETFYSFFKEIKDDMREREARTREEINQREERFEKTVDKYQEDNKEREERIFAAIERLENKIIEENKEMKASLEKSEAKIEESTKHLQSMKNTTFWGQVAFIIGIAAIIVTFITQM